jgi:hypothetical protein
MKLDVVIDRVAAADMTVERDRMRRTVLEVIAALGLEVARDGEVYNPAEPERSRFPEQNGVRWAGSRRGR